MKNIFKKRKKPEFEIDIEKIIDIADISETYEKIYIENNIYIPFMLSGSNGIYIFLNYEEDEKRRRDLILSIKKKYGLQKNEAFFFLLDEQESYLVEKDNVTLIELKDIYVTFENIYMNTMRPYIEYMELHLEDYSMLIKSQEELEDIVEEKEVEDTGDIRFVKPLVSQMIIEKIEKLNGEQRNQQYIDENTRIDEDGTLYIQKYETVKILGLIKGKKWYRCSEEDPDKIFLLTFLGGWFGLNKFREGKIKTGLFYLITCGCAGIFYVIDLINMITGTKCYEEITYEEDKTGYLKRYKEKVFYKKLTNWKKAIIAIPLSIVISYILMNGVYKNLFFVITDLLSSITSLDIVKENIEKSPLVNNVN